MKSCRVLLGCLLLLPVVYAGDVYRWEDASGRVHYGERPPHDQARRLDIQSGSGAAAPTLDEAERRARQRRLLESFTYEREQRESQRQRDAAQREQQARRCQKLQRHWRRLSYAGPIYFKEANGERRFLNDAERAAEKDSLRPAMREVCGQVPE